MELHESLYALGRSQGRELFNDADSFRGALDDYLDEDSASTGDINLLVDAVRLGAYQAMIGMLDSGADADRAVTSLARHAVISSAAAGGRSGERVGCEARMERTSKSGSVLRRSP